MRLRRLNAAAAAPIKPKIPTLDWATPSLRSLDVCGSVPLSAAPVELAVAAEFELDELEGADDELDEELDELEAFVAEPESAVAAELVELESAVLVAVSLADVSGAKAAVDEDSALEPDSLVLAAELPVVLSESD